MSDTYEIYAIRYGHHDRRSHENFLGGDPHDILQHIVPGHDPQTLTQYPAARPGLEGWVVRLDADPS